MSQKEKVLKYLQQGNTITNYDAFVKFNITRLGAVIFELRRDGHDVKCELVRSEDKKVQKFARYSLDELKA